MRRKILLVGLVIVFVVATFGCGGNNNDSGSAAPASAAPAQAPAQPPEPAAPAPTVGIGDGLDGWWKSADGYELWEFQGNNLITLRRIVGFTFRIHENRIEVILPCGYIHDDFQLRHTENAIFSREQELKRISGSGELDGIWVFTHDRRWGAERNILVALEFQGNNFTFATISGRGTFSIDDDRGEFINYDGLEWDFDFSRIGENTITIDQRQFTRVR